MSKRTVKSAGPVVTADAVQLALIENANTLADMDVAGAAVVDAFRAAFKGLKNGKAGVARFLALRTSWVGAYQARRKCSEKSAQNRFAEMVKAAGVVKPQTAEAAAKQATRAAKPAKPADKSQTAGNVPAQSIAGPAKGAAVGTKVKAELSAMEAHILDLYRRGKLADVITLLQSEMKKAAPV